VTDLKDFFELASYVVTVFGAPLLLYAYVSEQRKERENEDEEAFQQISDAYIDFLKLVLANPDLKLRSETHAPERPGLLGLPASPALNEEQQERRLVLFELLISLFERAYILLYDERMTPKQRRRWNTWEDYLREWCRREDFRDLLPRLLIGEDAEFAGVMRRLALEEARARLPSPAARAGS
jgi:hypothetical protein